MKIGIIGGGNMGGAIAVGLAKSGAVAPTDIMVTGPTPAHLAALAAKAPGIATSTENIDATRGTDIIILAVKPWLMEQVLKSVAPRIDFRSQVIISISAGITLDTINSWLSAYSSERTIFRAMPNTAIAIGQSMTFICHSNATPDQVAAVEGIFATLGKAAVIEERLMGAATALCSCGIAYAMRYVRAATEGGVQLGFYASSARDYILQTLRGAVELLEATGNNPEVEIDKVTTPGGVTIRGLNAMETNGFTNAVIQGLLKSV
ncbi:MAG: pyrroline-5-carboxylate reductase [Pseudoflavonifractor sp.]|nr:pyrroline-5-carboxylate reductase [Pseudoflavonifractor sp.]